MDAAIELLQYGAWDAAGEEWPTLNPVHNVMNVPMKNVMSVSMKWFSCFHGNTRTKTR